MEIPKTHPMEIIDARNTDRTFEPERNIPDNQCNSTKKQKTQFQIRKLEEQDIQDMLSLFYSTVLNVNIRDYTREEVEDWASCGDKPERWRELMAGNLFIGAFDGHNCLAGFSSMNKDGHLHSMFVHKDCQGQGVATQLLSEVEQIARQYGVSEITSEVSLTARTFFEKHGYKIVRMQKQRAKKLELTNFVMRKIL